MRKNIFIIVVIALVLIVGRMVMSNVSKMQSASQRKAAAVPTVNVGVVGSENIQRQFTTTARVMAKYRVDVLARISGYLTRSYFKEGDFVKAGQVLFEIEPQQYQYAAGQAKASMDNAQSQYDYYQKQLARYKELVAQDYVAKADYDSILSQRDAYRAQVENAKTQYQDAQRNLGYTKVKSPVDGRVGLINVTVGNFVSMNSGALTTINSYEPMYITFPLESKDFAELVRIDGSPNVMRDVEFIFSSDEKYEYKGVQDFHDNKVDENTGAITMRGTFPNPKNQLLQGDFGKVIIYSKNKDDMPIVPQSATMENQEGLYVFVMDEQNIPKMSYIKTMGQSGTNWIVSDGVKAGDRIITAGMQKVIPGSPVKVVETAVSDEQKPVKKQGLVQKVVNKLKKILSGGNK